MLTELIYKHLIGYNEITEELTLYKGSPAIFFQHAPDDVNRDWSASEYTRIVYHLNMNSDVERKISGLLQLNIHCPNSVISEKLSLIAKAALDGFFISDHSETYSIQWNNTDYLSYDDSAVSTAVVLFRLLAFPSQLTGAARDPSLLINEFTKELFPDAKVIGFDSLSGVWKPTEITPALYWRHGERTEDYKLPTGAAATFYQLPLYGHVIANNPIKEHHIAQKIIQSLYNKKVLQFHDKSCMRIDWDNRLNINADEYRDGQITVKATYCEQFDSSEAEPLNNIYFNRQEVCSMAKKTASAVELAENAASAENTEKKQTNSNISAMYTIDELAEASNRFKASSVLIRVALRSAGKTAYTLDEASEIIERFKKKEVK